MPKGTARMGNRIEDEYYREKDAVRLNKYISGAGYCSRREADRLIESGKVRVDGEMAVRGMMVRPGQSVTVGGRKVCQKDEMVALAVYKPAGIICTEERRTKNSIIRFLDYPVRITYAGRLDKDSEGLLIMTNNGELIQKIMRAGNYHEKEYKVTVDKEITAEFLNRMASGVHIRDEEKGLDAVTRACKVEKAGKYKFKITLTQGLNRQIRRMCGALGYRVVHLKRIRIMNIELGDLKPGEYRNLTDNELDRMYEMAAVSKKPRGQE